ncbi:T9SS C-terminal target domain-containing protein [Deminuibacter soli]|uniref:T9SS C-terminal target domain-containing protein n=2 Tax=Deminuibacter soli TaxID=2291815 RepID=A0A3E1NNQ6_9BACT|nr:T9SS C-terminal target domain-containing protein [Deminuibacter soli]
MLPVMLAAQSLTEIYLPQYAVTSNSSLVAVNTPFVFRLKLSGLQPGTTYFYFNSGVTLTAVATNNGIGSTINVNAPGFQYFSNTPNFNTPGSYATLTTDVNGEYTGWFVLDIGGRYNSQFADGAQFRIRVLLNDGNGGTTIKTRLTTTSAVTSLFAGDDVAHCTGVRSTAVTGATPKNFVLLWDKATPGAGDRPIAGSYIEDAGIPATESNIVNDYPAFYQQYVIGKNGTWGTFIPNNLSTGIVKIAEYSFSGGTEVSSKASADGSWPGTDGGIANTANASGADVTELVIDGSGGGVKKQDQTISFDPLPTGKKIGDADFSLSAQASSGLPVGFTSSDANVAEITTDAGSNLVVHITGRGTTTITASQPGDAKFNAAPAQTQTLAVDGTPQTLSFSLASPVNQDDADILLNATSTATGVPVTYTSSNTAIATIVTSNGKQYLHLTGNGTVSVTAAQNGTSVYNPATPVTVTIVVTPGKLVQALAVNFTSPKITGDADFPVSASSDAGLTNFAYNSSNPAVASVDAQGNVHIFSAGTTDITVTEPGDATYKAATITKTLVVNKAANNITFANFGTTKTYGNASEALDVTATAADLVTVSSSNTSVASVSKNALNQWELSITGAGTAVITASANATANYEAATPVSYTLTVSKAPLQVIADDKSKLPGADLPAFTWHANGWVYNDNEVLLNGLVQLNCSADKNSPAGNYAITIQQNLTLANYTISYKNGNLSVSDIAFNPINPRVYGDAPFNPGATAASGLAPVYSSNNPAVAVIDGNGNVAIKGAGSATITASFDPGNGNPAATASQVLTVNKKQVDVTVDNASRVYGTANPAAYTMHYSGLVNGETETVFTAPAVAAVNANIASPSGVYAISLSGAAAANYSFSYTNGTLTVTRAALIVTADNKSKTYGPALLPVPTYSITGWVLNDGPASVSFFVQASHTVPVTTGAGAYNIDVTGVAATANYNISYVPGTLTIGKAALTIAANNQTRNRGEDNPRFTVNYSGFVNGDDASKLAVPVAVATTAQKDSPAGTYDIIPSTAASDNYNIAFVNGTLTVNNAQIITWNPFSAMTYGDAPFDPAAVSDAGGSPVYTTDNPAVAIIENGKVRITGAGTASITAVFAATGAYPVTMVSQRLTVLRKPLTITVPNYTKKQGQLNPAFALTYKGFVNNDDNTAFTTQPTVSTAAGTNSPAGYYPITVSGAVSPSYSFTYVPGTLTVLPPLKDNIIDFPGLPVLTYGTPDYTLIAGASSGLPLVFTSSDTSVAVIDNNRVHIKKLGTVSITASQSGDNVYLPAQDVVKPLVIVKGILTITADSIYKQQGDNNPTLVIRYQGFAPGEDSSILPVLPAATTTAVKESQAGTYTIVVNGPAATENYAIRYGNGVLTVLPPAGLKEDYLSAWCNSAGNLRVNVNLQQAGKLHLQLFDISGKRLNDLEIAGIAGANTYNIPVQRYAAGMYMVRVITANGNTLKSKVFIVH